MRDQARNYMREALEIQAQGDIPPVYMQAVAGEGADFPDRDDLRCVIEALCSAFCELDGSAEKSVYFWFDALAGQLRACIAETREGEFLQSPFSCAINASATVEDVLADTEAEMSSLYGKGRLDVYVQKSCP